MPILKNQAFSYFLVDSSGSLWQSTIIKLVEKLNHLNQMNKQLVTQVVEELKQERQKLASVSDDLRKLGLPSSEKTLQELAQKIHAADSAIKSFNDYISLPGVHPNGANGTGYVPSSSRNEYIKGIIERLGGGEVFDIHRIRDLACQTFPEVFGKPKKNKTDFYPVYWGVINNLLEQKKIKVETPGKGKRSTVFVKI